MSATFGYFSSCSPGALFGCRVFLLLHDPVCSSRSGVLWYFVVFDLVSYTSSLGPLLPSRKASGSCSSSFLEMGEPLLVMVANLSQWLQQRPWLPSFFVLFIGGGLASFFFSYSSWSSPPLCVYVCVLVCAWPHLALACSSEQYHTTRPRGLLFFPSSALFLLRCRRVILPPNEDVRS